LLSKVGAEFDAGDEDQAVILAGILRLLLSDGFINRVISMKKLRFTDTAHHPQEQGAIGGHGFGITRILAANDWLNGEPRGGRIVAPLGETDPETYSTVVFRDWWSRDFAIYPTNRPALTRKYVVHEMANTDGIHIDSRLDGDYEALTRDNHGFQVNGALVTGNLASAAVRQIAWETQHTLHRARPDLFGSEFPSRDPNVSPGTYLRVAWSKQTTAPGSIS
jgi:hypothetical protein